LDKCSEIKKRKWNQSN